MSRTENDFENSLEYWRDLAKMLREELKKEQASRELKLPELSESDLAEFSPQMIVAWNMCIEQIKALNEGEGI